MTAITTPEHWSLGSSGVLGPSTELKLQDYVTSHSPPQGEIWIRGPNVFAGYFKHPELDAESITPDGWFKTGDIGQWEKDGTLSIIDRIKNLVSISSSSF
jgi:long-chain acyl-CoA synthetase